MATGKNWRELSASSCLLLGAAIWYIYFSQSELPLVYLQVAPEFRHFLVSYTPMAAYGLAIWGVATQRLTSQVLRYLLGGLSALFTLFYLWQFGNLMMAGGGNLATLASVGLPLIILGPTAWFLLSSPSGGKVRMIWLTAVALLYIAGHPALFIAKYSGPQYELSTMFIHLILGPLPFLIMAMGFFIYLGWRSLSLAASVLYALVTVFHLLVVIRLLQGPGQAAAPAESQNLINMAVVALAAGLLAVVNFLAFRRAGD